MRRSIAGRETCWLLIAKRFRLVRSRAFCTDHKSTINNSSNGRKGDGSLISHRVEAYNQLDKLDFMTAAKILFTAPPDKKKFGIDFHLVQLFFVCMPSLAVYLVAQYARYEMRRMEAEVEQKKKAEEEAKAKETASVTEEKEAASSPELLEVKVRLNKLEETLKEIVVESNKQSGRSENKNQEDGDEKKHCETSAHRDIRSGSEANSAAEIKQTSEKIIADSSKDMASALPPGKVTDESERNQKGTQSDPYRDAKK